MKTVYYLLISFLSLPVIAYSQEIISSGGDYFSNVNGSLSSTIGEPVSETFSGNMRILTQGFQQSTLLVMTDGDVTETELAISAYPNPASTILTIDVKNAKNKNLSYKLFEIDGKLIMHSQFEAPSSELKFDQLPCSSYILKIYSSDAEIKSFKIIKQ